MGRAALPLLLAVGIAFVTLSIATGRSVAGDEHKFGPALMAWVRSGSTALLWMVMAFGFGGAIAQWLGLSRRAGLERFALEGGLGIACGLVLDHTLGWLGLLVAFRGGGAWLLTIVGAGLLIWRWRRGDMKPLAVRAPLVVLALGPALGVLLTAATSEPGWLWSSEFGGYDALSYHLQLPKEWLAAGVTTTLPYNVYSGFPSFVENAFVHVFVLAGGHESGAVAAQCLSAMVTLVATLAVAALGRRVGGPIGAAVAAVLFLGTPWIVVVGSLAYNDGFLPLFLASGLLLVTRPPNCTRRFGLALGLLVAGACGAKLTAVGFVVLPLSIVALLHERGRGLVALAVAAVTASVLMAPWLIRNLQGPGDPAYPFFSSAFGIATNWPWSPEQAAVFAKAHSLDLGVGDRLMRLWDLFFRFGFGANPHPGEPWLPQWSLLPILGSIAIGLGFFARPSRHWAALCGVVVVAQIAFWLTATHLQSRFLIPAAVPLAVACAALSRRVPKRVSPPAFTAMGLLWCLVPLWIYWDEKPLDDGTGRLVGAPAFFIGNVGWATGDRFATDLQAAPDDATKEEILRAAPTAYFINHVLPPNQPVLLIGESTPFWYRRALAYTTVFDRGVFDRIVAENAKAPDLWGPALSGLGVRFVLINEPMLARWHRSGWLNPEVTAEGLSTFLRSAGKVVPIGPGVVIVDLASPTATK